MHRLGLRLAWPKPHEKRTAERQRAQSAAQLHARAKAHRLRLRRHRRLRKLSAHPDHGPGRVEWPRGARALTTQHELLGERLCAQQAQLLRHLPRALANGPAAAVSVALRRLLARVEVLVLSALCRGNECLPHRVRRERRRWRPRGGNTERHAHLVRLRELRRALQRHGAHLGGAVARLRHAAHDAPAVALVVDQHRGGRQAAVRPADAHGLALHAHQRAAHHARRQLEHALAVESFNFGIRAPELRLALAQRKRDGR
eukprot:6181537-Pleurochrysis_carterae.AAC.1